MAPKVLTTSRTVIGTFYQKLEVAPASWVNRFAMKINSTQASETYAWLGQVPAMREWVGGRLAQDLPEYKFTIDNKDHEVTLEVNVKDLRRDNFGQLSIRIGELAQRTMSYPATLLSRMIIDGESKVCYDGQYFFDTDHSEGKSGSQSNDISVDISMLPVSNHGSQTAPSVSEMAGAILAGVSAILGFKDDQGEPINEGASSFEVMVPVSLWQVAVAATKLPTIDGGDSNTIPAVPGLKIDVIVNPRLTWTDKFSVFRTDSEAKPFILQEEEPVQIDAVAEGSELEFKERKHWYGVLWGGNVGYGYWQHSCLVTMT